MRSRSYSAIVLSSFLLTTISCLSKAPSSDEESAVSAEAKSVRLDSKKDDAKEEAQEEIPEAADENATEGFEEGLEEGLDTMGAEREGEEAPEFEEPKPKRDGCIKGAMRFEGRCLPKDKVDYILHNRKRKALKRVQQAQKPDDAALAAHDLLEQQIAQVDKAEDDLDEIIEELKEEQKRDQQAAMTEEDHP